MSLALKKIGFSYHQKVRKKVLKDVSVTLEEGRITAVLGPSGSGKTTLLNLIAGLLLPEEGEILWNNVHQKIGYVFQQPSLIPWRSVWQNIKLGAEIGSNTESPSFDEDRALGLLKDYKLIEYKDAKPSELSGGMQQRVSIIRAVLSGAKVLLLDEPFGNLDYVLRRDLQGDLSELVDKENLIAVLVTHDLAEAVKLGDQIVVLGGSPSLITEIFQLPTARQSRLKSDMRELAQDIEQIKYAFEAN